MYSTELMLCRECGEEISIRAVRCPYCGAINIGRKIMSLVIGGVLLAAAAVIVFLFF